MDGEKFYGAAYKGSKQFTQQKIRTANATGFGAAAGDYAERGIDLNEQLIRNKPATFFRTPPGPFAKAVEHNQIFDFRRCYFKAGKCFERNCRRLVTITPSFAG